MTTQVVSAGLLLGAVSSFHCVGMCGPLVLALPQRNSSRLEKSLDLCIYHAGRIFVYACFGLIFGLAGRGIYLAGFQRWFSVSVGALILLLVFQYFLLRNSFQPVLAKKIYQQLQTWIIFLWKNPSKNGLFLLGVANGLLPCGMVYFAVAGALSLSQVGDSVLFMMMFGAGTLPMLLGVSYFGSFISGSVRSNMRKLIPLFVAAMGILLVLRGLNLGIPFISPVLETSKATIICR